jgi:hypothetical protein
MQMSSDSEPRGAKRDLEDVTKIEPGSKKANQGQAANGGKQAGPRSDEAGRPLAPQTGEPIDHSH